jgi:hypothetical protein
MVSLSCHIIQMILGALEMIELNFLDKVCLWVYDDIGKQVYFLNVYTAMLGFDSWHGDN